MSEQKKPQSGEYWLTRGGERRYVVAVLPESMAPYWRIITVDHNGSTDSHAIDGSVLCDCEYKCDLIEHLPWCTSFDDPEPVAETWPKWYEAWMGHNAFIKRVSEAECQIWNKDGTHITQGWMLADNNRKEISESEALARLNPPATTCHDCNQPLTPGHADVCPMAWVVQDRVPARPGIDERAWQWKDGCTMDWVDARVMLADPKPKHGHQSGCRGPILHLRCRRKDLPPLPSPEPSTPDPGEVHPLGPHSSEPDTVPVRLFLDAVNHYVYANTSGTRGNHDVEILIVGNEFRVRKAVQG